MPLFEKNGEKVLFVHIPKTGGSSIEAALEKITSMTFFSHNPPEGLVVCPQHLQVGAIRSLLGAKGWHWSCAIVRDPYDRLESEYFYRLRNHRPDFSTWVMYHIESARQNRSLMDNHFRPQSDFIDSGVAVYRYEDGLNAVLKGLTDHLNLDALPTLPTVNVGVRAEVTWSTEALTVVNSFYDIDFERLGYRKRKQTLKGYAI